MRFALINNERVEASPKLKGLCPGCLQPVTAKCGSQRMWHWAHLVEVACDSYKEKETEWHRAWKANFPMEWQECRQQDQSSGEWHIADVRTSHGLVIEFQHSHIDPEERISREKFYRGMVWVVNGTRLKLDYRRFLQGAKTLRHTKINGAFLIADPEQFFPSAWLESSVPVFFDFLGIAPVSPPDMRREHLWCLLPLKVKEQAIVICMPRQDFLSKSSNKPGLMMALAQISHGVMVEIDPPRQVVRPQTTADLYRASLLRGKQRKRL